jgi:hypothetical protein
MARGRESIIAAISCFGDKISKIMTKIRRAWTFLPRIAM